LNKMVVAAENESGSAWLQVRSLGDGLWIVDEGGFVSWYVLAQPDGQRAVAIDCGWGICQVRPQIEQAVGMPIDAVALTHIHPDHHGAVDEFSEIHLGKKEWDDHGRHWNAGLPKIKQGRWQPARIFEDMPAARAYPATYDPEVYTRRVAAGVPQPDFLWNHGDIFTLAGRSCQVVLVPGHTQGHVAWYFPKEQWFFVGDALVQHQWWWHLRCRADLVAGQRGLQAALEVLSVLPDHGLVLPAHGASPLAPSEVAGWVRAALDLFARPVPGAACQTPVGPARRHRLHGTRRGPDTPGSQQPMAAVDWLVHADDWQALLADSAFEAGDEP
jgi:glyoxylase-like metal-dependent hydrolase (beta-lactamase superfamily II)